MRRNILRQAYSHWRLSLALAERKEAWREGKGKGVSGKRGGRESYSGSEVNKLII